MGFPAQISLRAEGICWLLSMENFPWHTCFDWFEAEFVLRGKVPPANEFTSNSMSTRTIAARMRLAWNLMMSMSPRQVQKMAWYPKLA
jgi:hypothetical protein